MNMSDVTHSRVSRVMDAPPSSSRSTTYESRTTSYAPQDDLSTYRTTIAPRNMSVNSRAFQSGPTPYRNVSIERTVRQMQSLGSPANYATAMASQGVGAVKQSRQKEKRDMQDLNERLASYVEKVRFLEAQNRKLSDELEKLKSKWGKETSQIKAMYQAELDEARRLLDEAVKDKARHEIKAASHEEHISKLKPSLNEANKAVTVGKENIDRLHQQLADTEAERNLLRRRIESLETEREKDKKQIQQLLDAHNQDRMDLDSETLLRIEADSRRQTLEEEIEFLKAVHEQELKELMALVNRDSTSDNRDYWKNEMGQALREIQQIYDEKIDGMRDEMETIHNMKIQDMRAGAARQAIETAQAKDDVKNLRSQIPQHRDKITELQTKIDQLQRALDASKRDKDDDKNHLEADNNDLKMEVAKLKAELEAILKELQDIMDTKLGLELEIAAYRKLLEGEENRIALKDVADGWLRGNVGKDESNESPATTGSMPPLKASQIVKGEISAKTTYQRSAKGPCSVAECSADGKYIALENTGRKEEYLGGWKIKRNIEGVDRIEYTLDNNFIIRPNAKVKIWAYAAKPYNATINDLECNLSNWGVGANITTRLINSVGEDRATHIQRTVYTTQT